MLLNFGWVQRGRLAGMAFPGEDTWPLLVAEGVGAVLTLTRRSPPGDPEAAGLASLHVPIPDFGVPTDADLRRALAWMREQDAAGRAVVVHCHAGMGRTGMLLAARLVDEGMPWREAVRTVRGLRPGSIETPGQMDVVRRYDRTRSRGARRGRREGGGS